MTTPRRIALIAPDADGRGYLTRFQRLPWRPAVRVFDDLYGSSGAIQDFRPDTLIVSAEAIDSEDLGALRLYESLLGDPAVLLLVPREREVALAPLCERIAARVLLTPFADRDLAIALSVAHDDPTRTAPDVFVDLVRGLGDEINNPLLFARGYLQLLENALADDATAEVGEHVRNIARGLDRIGRSVDRLQVLHAAAALRTDDLSAVPVAEPLAEAVQRTRTADSGQVELVLPDEAAGANVRADRALLETALHEFLVVGRQLAKVSAQARLGLEAREGAAAIQLDLVDTRLSSWQIPRTFEPYYFGRVLRGSVHGLSLFLVQAVVQAHGGQATAQRTQPADTVRFELLWPSDG